MTTKIKIGFSFIILLFLFISCEKEDFTKPSPTTFSFILLGTSNSIEHLSFSKIQLIIKEFEFEGVRNNAPDFFFEEVFEEDLNLEWPASVEMLDFEIPQGVYETVEISFRLSGQNENGVTIEGIYRSLEQRRNVLLLAEIGRDQSLEMAAETEDGSSAISFTKGTLNQASIEFDATGLFGTISRDRMEQAVNELDVEETLIISEELNSDILNVLESQLQDYMKVTFK